MTSYLGLLRFAKHEIRLTLRDLAAALRAKGLRRSVVISGVIIVLILLHLLAYIAVRKFAGLSFPFDKNQIIILTAVFLMSWILMLSQAIESMIRVMYTRSDLDLIMSSPADATSLFAVRIGAVAVTVTAITLALSAPFVSTLVAFGGPRWFAALGLVIVTGLSTTVFACVIVILLFFLAGPRRTRLVAQVVSAVIGAGYVIGLQLTSAFSTGTLSRFTFLTSTAVTSHAPDDDSLIWWPIRAALGDGKILVILMIVSFALMVVVVQLFAPVFVTIATRIASNPMTFHRHRNLRPIRRISPKQALRFKELTLVKRSPWLLSQNLMQLLYLFPTALLLFLYFLPPSLTPFFIKSTSLSIILKSMAEGGFVLILLTGAIVMAAGQLAGGLSWLMISGEDTPDLIASAPLLPSHATRTKIEVVLILLSFIFAPLILLFGFIAPLQAGVTTLGLIFAVVSATIIQLRFRVQGRRDQFRRRQNSPRIATLAESFSAVGWAATSAFTLSYPIISIFVGTITIIMLAVVLIIIPNEPRAKRNP